MTTTAHPTDWNTTPDGEAKQADYVAQFYTLLFSHPSVRAITWWDFSDANAWLGAPSGLVRKDMTPKPAYTRLMDLIHTQWWTNATGKTNRAGSLRGPRFLRGLPNHCDRRQRPDKDPTVAFPEAAPPLAVTLRFPETLPKI